MLVTCPVLSRSSVSSSVVPSKNETVPPGTGKLGEPTGAGEPTGVSRRVTAAPKVIVCPYVETSADETIPASASTLATWTLKVRVSALPWSSVEAGQEHCNQEFQHRTLPGHRPRSSVADDRSAGGDVGPASGGA